MWVVQTNHNLDTQYTGWFQLRFQFLKKKTSNVRLRLLTSWIAHLQRKKYLFKEPTNLSEFVFVGEWEIFNTYLILIILQYSINATYMWLTINLILKIHLPRNNALLYLLTLFIFYRKLQFLNDVIIFYI